MKLTPEQTDTARAILRDGPNHFTALARRAGLDPATAWIDADLRGITLVAEDDVSGYVFLRTDLRGADLRLATGKDRATFRDVVADETTLGLPGATDFVPPDDYMDHVNAMILRGEAPPAEWVPFITRLEISEPEWWMRGKERLAFSDLRPLAGLSALTSLDLQGTRVSDVGPLAGLTSLRDLYVDRSKIRNLYALRHLARLRILDTNHPFDKQPQPALSGSHRAPSGALAPLRRAARRVASWFVR